MQSQGTKSEGVGGVQASQRLKLLAEVTRVFAEAVLDERELFRVIAEQTANATGEACTIRLLSDDGVRLEPIAAHHPDSTIRQALAELMQKTAQSSNSGVWKTVVTQQKTLHVPAAAQRTPADASPEQLEFIRRFTPHASMLVPLVARGRVIGGMSLVRFASDSDFSEDDEAFLRELADRAALSIDNARSYAAAVRANRALKDSEEAQRLLFDASPLPLFVFDIETLDALAVNEAALALYGYEREEFLELKVNEHAVADRETARARVAALGDTEATGTTRYRRKDGSEFIAEYSTRALPFGRARARVAVIKDVTDRAEAERMRALLAAVVESSNDAIVSKRLDGIITSWNAAAQRLFGYSAEEAIGRSINILIPPDRLDEERSLIERIRAGERVEHFETLRRRKDGSDVCVSISVAPVLDASGAVVGASKTARDLTSQRKASEALRRTEEQLRQAQKMEAVGRLAGGIAHDFNNILSVILSYSQMLINDIDPKDPLVRDADEIHRAAARAAELTRQLLLFSRQRVVEPKVLDLNEILAGTDKMLRRILGEDIDLASIPAPDLGLIHADPSSMEQVLMNLVVNARDAMPTGGKLTIETRNVELDANYAREHLGSAPGPHVMLAVSDTGIGMDAATLAHIFEPFFTTKEPGKGTGLGLSTVFGIAQQCGGSVWVYSELGKGTTFKVYFPRTFKATTERPLALQDPVTLRGTETILLVEDQEQVRTVAEDILKRNGYRVIVAQNAGEALLICEKHRGSIHLLLTDVVMPHMSGTDLAKRLASTRAEMRVLCMSGYTDDSIIRHGVLDGGIEFLQKPFSAESLARKVREVLNAPAR